MNERPSIPATFWGPIIGGALTAIHRAADPGEPETSQPVRNESYPRRSGPQITVVGVPAKLTIRRIAAALMRADAVYGRLNRVLLGVAILLGVMVLALDAEKDRGTLLLRHPGSLGSAWDLERSPRLR